MDSLEYVIANKEWIFSGAGIAIFSFITGALVWGFKKKSATSTKEDQYGSLSKLFPGYEESKNRRLISLYDLIPNFLLKKIFPESRLLSLISFDVRPRGESVRLNLGELPNCNVYLVCVNHSPFDIEFESIKAKLSIGGCAIRLEGQNHVKVKKHSTNYLVYLEGDLTGDQAIHCSKKNTTYPDSLSVTARFRCSFGAFTKNTDNLECINSNIINAREV